MAAHALLRACCLLAAALTLAKAAVVVNLGEAWTLQNANASVSLDDVSVPSYPLAVLQARGLIEDPNYRYGELESRWVALDTWTYTLQLDDGVLAPLAGAKEVVLQLGGIDTFATVSLNGQQILSANNFHRSWAVPVKRFLKADSPNSLVITIRPAAQESVSLKASHPYTVPSLAQMGSIGAYVFARKPASDFGWDWGPAYAPSGIHGTIRLLGYDAATLTSAYVAQNREATADGDVFRLDITSSLLVPPGGDEGELLLEIPGLDITHRQALALPDKPGYSSGDGVSIKGSLGGLRIATITTQLSIPAESVKLWWPVGYGKQPLYDVNLAFVPKAVAVACAGAKAAPRSLLSSDAEASAPQAAQEEEEAHCQAASRDFTTLSRRIGFRTVELVRLPIHAAVKDLFPEGEAGWGTDARFYQQKDSGDGNWAGTINGTWQHFARGGDQSSVEGESFYFKVNGLPIFMKGANYIPSHIIHTSVTAETLTDTLDYALQSNMNMIRVWGGGRYPVDHLFNYADEKGIIIWMETMFACSPYPRDPAFLDNVAAEVAQQAQRLSWHPSVGIWGGNNEIEGSLNWYAESRSNRALFANDYQSLFIDTIRAGLRQINPHMPFVDSSPSNGVIADNDREYVKRWGDDWDWRWGDVHWYAYESDCEDWTTYPKAKFISEFGSQSLPTFATYAEATSPADWQVDNPMTGFRNRRFGNGLEVFEAQFRRHFRLPDAWSVKDDPAQSLKLFKSFLYITHMQQTRCYEAAINYWRRLRSQPAGMTMGVLYWQLNDNSHFASWSSYDYSGRWKPLAYSVKRMYAPLQVQAITNPATDAVQVFLVNDHVTPVATRVTVSVLSLRDDAARKNTCSSSSSAKAAAAASVDFTVPPGFASEAWSMPVDELLATQPGCTRHSCYVSVSALALDGQDAAGEASEAQLWLVPLKDINLPNPGLQLTGFAQQTVVAAEPAYYSEADAEAVARATNSYEGESANPDMATDAADEAGLMTLPAASYADAGAGTSASSAWQPEETPAYPTSFVREAGAARVASTSTATFRNRLWAKATGKQMPLAGKVAAAAAAARPTKGKPGKNKASSAATASTPAAAVKPAAAASAGAPITFTLSASRPAALTTLVTKYRGRFSDDGLTALHPCAPRTVTFYPHASVGRLSPEDLAADLRAESLYDHQYGAAQPAKQAPKQQAPHQQQAAGAGGNSSSPSKDPANKQQPAAAASKAAAAVKPVKQA